MVGPWFESRTTGHPLGGGGSSLSNSDEENVEVLYNSAVAAHRCKKTLEIYKKKLKYHGYYEAGSENNSYSHQS